MWAIILGGFVILGGFGRFGAIIRGTPWSFDFGSKSEDFDEETDRSGEEFEVEDSGLMRRVG